MSLTKHADGSWRTPDGYGVVVMLRSSGKTEDGKSLFDFVADQFAAPIRIVWDGDATVIDAAYLHLLTSRKWARNLTDEEAARAEIDGDTALVDTDPEQPKEEPPPPPPPPKAMPEPIKQALARKKK